MIVVALVVVVMIVGAARLRPTERRSPARELRRESRRFEAVAVRALHRRHHRPPDARAVAAWCDEISRSLRSGSTLREAVMVVPADVATERATMSLRLGIERGLSVVDAAGRAERVGAHVGLALGVVASVARVGGPAAAGIDRTATLLRQRAADLDERATHAAQARLSAHVMTALPLLLLGVLVATDDDVRSVTTSSVGAACIAGGLVLNAIGWWWMRRLVMASS